jgi:SAM-dependent methyltransferase
MQVNERDLEWQRRYEEKDTPWDKAAPAPALVKFLREGRITGRVLVPGCGLGHEARALAAQPGVSVVGLDFAPAAIEAARRFTGPTHPEAELSFVLGDLFALPGKLQRSFDWVVEHTCFCAIDPARRPDYVQAAAEALRSDGHLFAIFYINPDSETSPPFPSTREELDALFGTRFELEDEWVPAESFPGREQRELVRILRKRAAG